MTQSLLSQGNSKAPVLSRLISCLGIVIILIAMGTKAGTLVFKIDNRYVFEPAAILGIAICLLAAKGFIGEIFRYAVRNWALLLVLSVLFVIAFLFGLNTAGNISWVYTDARAVFTLVASTIVASVVFANNAGSRMSILSWLAVLCICGDALVAFLQRDQIFKFGINIALVFVALTSCARARNWIGLGISIVLMLWVAMVGSYRARIAFILLAAVLVLILIVSRNDIKRYLFLLGMLMLAGGVIFSGIPAILDFVQRNFQLSATQQYQLIYKTQDAYDSLTLGKGWGFSERTRGALLAETLDDWEDFVLPHGFGHEVMYGAAVDSAVFAAIYMFGIPLAGVFAGVMPLCIQQRKFSFYGIPFFGLTGLYLLYTGRMFTDVPEALWFGVWAVLLLHPLFFRVFPRLEEKS